MPISREVATKAYSDHVAQRTAEDELAVNLLLGELDSASEEVAANDELSIEDRKGRLQAGIAGVQGNSSHVQHASTPQDLVKIINDGYRSITGESPSSGQIAAIANVLFETPMHFEVDARGVPVELDELRRDKRQLENEKVTAQRRITDLENEVAKARGNATPAGNQSQQMLDDLARKATHANAGNNPPAPQGGTPAQQPAQAQPAPASQPQQASASTGSNTQPASPSAQGGTTPASPVQDQPKGFFSNVRAGFKAGREQAKAQGGN